MWFRGFENAVGVFAAHEDANDALILPEDNAHSEWNHNNDKLKDVVMIFMKNCSNS